MIDVLLFGLFMLVVGVCAGYELHNWVSKPKPLPYRWSCTQEGCGFKCGADTVNGLMRMVDDHIEDHSKEI